MYHYKYENTNVSGLHANEYSTKLKCNKDLNKDKNR